MMMVDCNWSSGSRPARLLLCITRIPHSHYVLGLCEYRECLRHHNRLVGRSERRLKPQVLGNEPDKSRSRRLLESSVPSAMPCCEASPSVRDGGADGIMLHERWEEPDYKSDDVHSLELNVPNHQAPQPQQASQTSNHHHHLQLFHNGPRHLLPRRQDRHCDRVRP